MFFLAGVYLIFGANLFIASLAGHLMGITIIILIYLIGRRYFNDFTAIAAVLLYTLYYPPLYFEGQLLVDTLFSLLLLASVYFLLRAGEGGKEKKFIILSGLTLGTAAITRANVLLFYPFALIWLYYLSRDFKKAGLYLIFALIPIIPITAINYFAGQDLVLIASQGGINFYIGNNEDADGMTANMPEFGVNWEYSDCKYFAEKTSGAKGLKPSQVSNFYYRRGLNFIVDNPSKALSLFLKKIYLSLNNYEISNNQSIYFSKQFSSISRITIIPFALILGFSIVGLFSPQRWRYEYTLLFFAIVSIWLTMVLFFVTSRFRLPLIPYLTIFAGYGIFVLYSTIRKRVRQKTLLPLIFGLIALLISITNFVGIRRYDFSQAYYNLGNIYLRNGEWKSALDEYRLAIEKNNEVSLARLNIGNIFFYKGNYDSAAYYYSRELKYHPKESRAYLNLSTVNLLKGEYKLAADYAERALKAKPNSVPAVTDYITSRLKSGDTSEAITTLSKYIKIFENDRRLCYALGKIYQQQSNIDSAIFYYRRAVGNYSEGIASEYNLGEVYSRDLPFSTDARSAVNKANYNLAVIEIQEGQFDKALRRLLKIVNNDRNFVKALINIGLIYDSKRDYPNAEKYLLRACELQPRNVLALYNLGLVYAKTGRLYKAADYFKRAIKVNPKFMSAREKYNLVEGMIKEK